MTCLRDKGVSTVKRIGISSIIAELAFIVAMAFAASAYGTPSASGFEPTPTAES
jgi:hypothetical protein